MSNPFQKLAALRDRLPPGDAVDEGAPAAPETPEAPRFAGKVVVRRERKGHGGKTVTVVDGVLADARAELVGTMKRALGCGARVDGERIVLQGDLLERAALFLEKNGAGHVVRGN